MTLRERFRIFEIDTSSGAYAQKQKETAEAVTSQILDWVAESVEENILSAPRSAFRSLEKEIVAERQEASELLEKFESVGSFRPRTQVEEDAAHIQPLPVVVVRNKSGHVLRLIRKEKDASNKLDRKIVLWAGGHVRREDGPDRTGAINAVRFVSFKRN
jgi:predicted NUDIX family phosphoesterase